MVVAFAVIAALNLWFDGKWWPWLFGLAGLLTAITYLSPSILHPLNRAWFKLGMLIHALISPIVMALLFFTAITATAVIMRIFGKNLLRLKRLENAQSYWIPRQPPGPTPDSMKDQF